MQKYLSSKNPYIFTNIYIYVCVKYQPSPQDKLPPTLASGNGVLMEEDKDVSATKLMDDHERKVKHWLSRAPYHLLENAVETARAHTYFPIFERDLWASMGNHAFGAKLMEDVLKFDMWLKKWEISETKKSIPAPAPAAPVKEETTASEFPPPKNPEAYKEYWKKFERKDASSTLSLASTESPPSRESGTPSTPSPSVASDSTTGLTPDCKRKLALEGWGFNFIFSKLDFWNPLYTMLHFCWDIHETFATDNIWDLLHAGAEAGERLDSQSCFFQVYPVLFLMIAHTHYTGMQYIYI